MKSLWLFLSLLQVSVCLRPTSLCFSKLFQADYYNMVNGDYGLLAVDFHKDLYSLVSDKSGIRIVRDFYDMKQYEIDSSSTRSTTCKTTKILSREILDQCLPSSAEQVYQAGGALSFQYGSRLVGYYHVHTWEVDRGHNTKYRFSFANIDYTTPTFDDWPIMMHELVGSTTNIYMFANATNNIGNRAVFEVPKVCDDTPIIG